MGQHDKQPRGDGAPRGRTLPDWLPAATRRYLAHTEDGQSIRALARKAEVHASTVLRQIRKTEVRRDDPLVDDALRRLAGTPDTPWGFGPRDPLFAQQTGLEAQVTPVLSRLAEPGAVLAVTRDMEMGVVVRDGPDGQTERTAVVERALAQAMALHEWIAPIDPSARIVRYYLTNAGRAALRSFGGAEGFAEAPRAFRHAESDDSLLRHARSAMPESPLVTLARRRDKDGEPFLTRPLVAAGERLREEYELARVGAGEAVDWRAALETHTPPPAGTDASGQAAARLWAALSDLGPGLGDVALRCCCELEGLESLERSMGWSARSGKIVLRIALQRLRRHFDEQGAFGPTIG